MGDMGDDFRARKESDKIRKEKNLEAFNAEGWTKHTAYHYSRKLLGDRIDLWPSKNKFQWRNKMRFGDVAGFIRNRESQDVDK